MASGGLLQGQAANESSYTGQMEYMGGMLGLLSTAIGGISTAISSLGGLGNVGKDLGEAIKEIFVEPRDENGDKPGKRNYTDKSPAWIFDNSITGHDQ